MSTYADRLQPCASNCKRDRLDGFVVPLTDEHMSEYVGAYAQRLAWLTGFQGSAGTAVVLPQEAAIFTDGRYTLQVREQVVGRPLAISVACRRPASPAWLGEHAPRGRRASAMIRGCTPRALGRGSDARRSPSRAPSWWRSSTNPIDAVWPDQPGAVSDAALSCPGRALCRPVVARPSAPRSPTG